MLSEDRINSFIRKPLDAGLTRSEQMEMATELLALRERLAVLDNRPTVQAFNKACSEGRKYRERAETAERKLAALGVEDVNSKVDITCYSCRRFITFQQHAEADGFCPYCNVEIELESKGD
ncbi:zinc-ribbon domain-containing protein [Yersinia frederiksenii]|uniref:zinc-ribbon domain-containing protein n=1 Tax=Yersinia frederiksenii TaxID=29484 RepID=UPI0005E218C9|nr:zinc-ribbon domain-containing protein [Yersinia frederiksenii]CFR14672.1 Uncharacterised protein [Yersinia frederiksenii]